VVKNKINMTKEDLDDLEYRVTGACIEVHKALGPGLLESVYHKCLKHELYLRKINYKSEVIVPVNYKGLEIEAELRCDFLIEDTLALELKAVDAVHPIHEAQILTYMKLLKIPKGLLVNFNTTSIVQIGKKSFVNEIYKERYLKD
jgi:GxxExxY protein